MVCKMRSPGALAGATGARKFVNASELDHFHDSSGRRGLQVACLARRYRLKPGSAALLAPLVFGEVSA